MSQIYLLKKKMVKIIYKMVVGRKRARKSEKLFCFLVNRKHCLHKHQEFYNLGDEDQISLCLIFPVWG